LLSRVFEAMMAAGPQVVQPFLQDVVQLGGLAQALWGVMRRDPSLVARLLPGLGLPELVAWAGHFGALGLYELLQRLTDRPELETDPQDYFWKRRREAWRYGCGQDYKLFPLRFTTFDIHSGRVGNSLSIHSSV